MPVPSSLALTNIADGSSIVAADHRNNYTSIQTAVNDLIAFFGGGILGSTLRYDGSTWSPTAHLILDDTNSKITLGGDATVYRGAASLLETGGSFAAVADITARYGAATVVAVGAQGPSGQAGLLLGGDFYIYRPGVAVAVLGADASGNNTWHYNNQINAAFGTNGTAQLSFNALGYNGGSSQFRNLGVYDGKNNLAAFLDGATKHLEFSVLVVGSPPADNNFTMTARDGMMALDTTDGRLYIRSGGGWRYATLT